MFRRVGLSLMPFLLLPWVVAAQTSAPGELTAFQTRLDRYVEMHRRLEGPLPPLAAAPDMDDVYRLMDGLRTRIRSERKREAQGYLLTPAMIEVVRARVAGCLTVDEIASAMADIDEHTPPGMPALRVNEALPEDAPFGMVPPQVIGALPRLPAELRWVVLSNSLVIWDHHADLVVDLAPGVFDSTTYQKSKTVRQ